MLPRHHWLLALVLAGLVGGCAPGPSATEHAATTAPLAATSAPPPTASPTPTQPPTPSPDPTPTSAILPGSVDRSSLEVDATYSATIAITVATGEIAVSTTLEARNVSGEPIDRLELNTVAARLGGAVVTAASVDDQPVDVTVDDQTFVVPLGGILPPGASASIALAYTARLRNDLDGSDWLFTRAGGTLALYRWIPWVSRAVPFDRPNHGDPFVTPSSRAVHVDITTDAPLELATPSTTAKSEPLGAGPGRAFSFDLADVRDVALVLAPDFELTTATLDGVEVRAYTRPGGLDGDRLLALAGRALANEADQIGIPYPWPAYSVVETRGGYGMESPGLIWIPRDTAPTNVTYLVHHETAHQWFYGLVGNDQQAEPFADEAAADLLARTVLGTLRSSRCDRAALDLAITRYSRACYYEVIYIQGGNVLNELRRAIGGDRFWAALRGYIEAHRFGLGGTRELLDALRAASPVDLLPTLRARFPDLY